MYFLKIPNWGTFQKNSRIFIRTEIEGGVWCGRITKNQGPYPGGCYGLATICLIAFRSRSGRAKACITDRGMIPLSAILW